MSTTPTRAPVRAPMLETLTASHYYGKPTPGWVVLRNGQPTHYTGPTAKRDASAAIAKPQTGTPTP